MAGDGVRELSDPHCQAERSEGARTRGFGALAALGLTSGGCPETLANPLPPS